MSFRIGEIVGTYRIIGPVGSGGMGQVFQVEHTVTKRMEAMKVLVDGRPDTPEQARRFLREIQVQAGLHHPHIASVHNAFWVSDDLVMVMELVEGVSLQFLLERGRIPLAEGVDYVCQALSALSYAHALGVVHRDIKPANIMVGLDGTVKLTDFGLAKAPADQRLTHSGAVLGSLYYMSPEQVRGIPTLDARTDIYSLGVVLYELATGSKPFDSQNAFSMMLAHVEQAPAPPLEVEPSLPAALNEIILMALAKKPGERFQSADLFRDALERVKQALRESPATCAPSRHAMVAELRSPARRWTRARGLQFRMGAAVIAFLALVPGPRRSSSPAPPLGANPVAMVEEKSPQEAAGAAAAVQQIRKDAPAPRAAGTHRASKPAPGARREGSWLRRALRRIFRPQRQKAADQTRLTPAPASPGDLGVGPVSNPPRVSS